ncbi:hypothetical protein Y032_0143g2419 [Ancylostoma ceylanicum]|uniref:Uncharacterized protein n=1 Tax=Ancylostoma ceylanicum TaxID=53326 RepID=A0A016T2F5_9BILA|nr:hypothetical protein Y032_0143g2419 [Ancylostoma ceylanicum]
MFDSNIIIFLECVAVFVPLYYSLVAARWINTSTKAMHVLSTATSPRKLNRDHTKNVQIDHGDSVSALDTAEIEKKVEQLRHEIGDSTLQNPSRTASVTQM